MVSVIKIRVTTAGFVASMEAIAALHSATKRKKSNLIHIQQTATG